MRPRHRNVRKRTRHTFHMFKGLATHRLQLRFTDVVISVAVDSFGNQQSATAYYKGSRQLRPVYQAGGVHGASDSHIVPDDERYPLRRGFKFFCHAVFFDRRPAGVQLS